jgi:hypothetical protein
MTSVTRIGNVDIQFTANWDEIKANQLVQTLQQVVARVNASTTAIAALQNGSADTSVAPHTLATTSGNGPVHTVSGLTAGQVLIATSATSVEFRPLTFSDLTPTDGGSIEAAANGDVMTFVDGYWSAAPPSSSVGIGLSSPGAFALLEWNNALKAYAWALPDSTLNVSGGAVGVVTGNLVHAQLANLLYVEGSTTVLANDHPQYGLLSAANTWTSLQTLTGGAVIDGLLAQGNLSVVPLPSDTVQQSGIALSGIEPYTQLVSLDTPTLNEAAWAIQVEPGMLRFTTVDDAGSWGEDWLTVTRVGELADAVNVSANSFTFNGDTVLTPTSLAAGTNVYLTTDAIGRTLINAKVGSGGGAGTVTSVGLSTPGTAIALGGTNPVTGSGTISVDLSSAAYTALSDALTALQPITGLAGSYSNPTVTLTAAGQISAIVSGGGVSGANPTASVGLAAVNGSAVTFMRSDAAPVLSQSIAPTWTGNHVFSGAGTPITVNAASSQVGVQINAGAGQFGLAVQGNGTLGSSYGMLLQAGTNNSDTAFQINSASASFTSLKVFGDGSMVLGGSGTPGGAKGYGTLNANALYISGNAAGYLEIPQNAQSTNYTLVLSDSGKDILQTSSGNTTTIPPNSAVPFPINTCVLFSVTSGLNQLIAPGTGVTLTQIPTGATGTRTLTGPGDALARQVSIDNWFITGPGLT